jgi:hypothetical protein
VGEAPAVPRIPSARRSCKFGSAGASPSRSAETRVGKPPVALVNSESTDQLSQNLRGDFASHVCQSKIAAGIVERQAFVVHSQQVQDRRV